ncbi:MAG TPA: hypothetical protein VGJ84_13835, partial [Polyangiaceae bacterium]
LGELLVDVANYSHAHNGPGVVLVGDACDYYMDESDGRRGLLFSRKRHAPPPEERLKDAFIRALSACRLLEGEEALKGRLAFDGREVLLKIVDRLETSNSDSFLETIRPELEPFLKELYAGAPVELTRIGSPKDLFSVCIRAGAAPSVETLLERLG